MEGSFEGDFWFKGFLRFFPHLIRMAYNVSIISVQYDKTMKTIVKITGNVVAAAFVLCGCQSGMYSTSVSVSERRGGMSDYFEVDRVRGLESKVYGERMPVVVSKIPRGRIATGAFRVERKKRRKAGKEEDRLDALCLDLLVSCGNLLGLCSFGVFPFFSSETVETEVCVETPLGEKCGTYSVTAATWTGWLPIFLPYPWFADERVSDPKLPHPRLADQACNRLVANLVSQFPKEDYAAFVAGKRREYVAEFRAKVEERLAAKDWQGTKDLCDVALSDVTAFAEDARARAEKGRVAEFRAKVEERLAVTDWTGVVELCDEEKSDVAFAEDARTRAEKGRVAEFRAKVEERLAANDWVGVVELCDEEKSDVAFVKGARARAEKIRVAEFRAKVEERLAANDWKGVVELCDGTAVSEVADVAFVKDARARAEKIRVAEFRAKVEKCLAAHDWAGVVELCDGETVSEASDVAFVKDARARAENGRVAEVRAEAEKLFKNDDWKALLALTRNENDTRMSELCAWAETRREREILNETEALQEKKNWKAIAQLTENETASELVKIRENAIEQIRKPSVEVQNGVELVDFIKSTRKRNLTRMQCADRFSRLKGRYVRVKGIVKDVGKTAFLEKPFVSIRVLERELDDGTVKELSEAFVGLAFMSALSGREVDSEDFLGGFKESVIERTTPSKIDIQFNVTEDASEVIRRWNKNETHTMRGRIVSMGDLEDDAECDDSEVVE